MLAQNEIKFTERDFFKQPFTRDELRALLTEHSLAPRDMLSTKSPSFRALNLEPDQLTDDQILDLMTREPRLIRRPLTAIGKQIVIGFDKAKLTQSLK